MSEEELSEYDDLINELDDEDEKLNVWGKELVPIKARQQAKMSGVGQDNTHDKKIWAHGGALTQDKVYMGKDLNSSLMDGIMPQSPVVSKHIDKQLSYRMSKDLESMGSSLNIGVSSNKLLKEDNEQGYDILIDDNFLNKEDEG